MLLADLAGGKVHLNLRFPSAINRGDLMCQSDGGRYDSRLGNVTCGECLLMAEAAMAADVARFWTDDDGSGHFQIFREAFPECVPGDYAPQCRQCCRCSWRPTTRGRHGAKCVCGSWREDYSREGDYDAQWRIADTASGTLRPMLKSRPSEDLSGWRTFNAGPTSSAPPPPSPTDARSASGSGVSGEGQGDA